MIRRMTTRRGIIVTSVLALGALATIASLALAGSFARPTAPDPLPPMTLIYEVYGPSIGVGDRDIPRFKEVRRLEYRGRNDWKETVITSPDIDLGRYGTASNAGSYYEVRGNTTTEYDAMDGSTTTGTRDGSGAEIPNVAFAFTDSPVASPLGPSITGVSVATNGRVCIGGVCTDNAQATKYTRDGREIILLSTTAGFVLPIKSGDDFILKSAQINGQ